MKKLLVVVAIGLLAGCATQQTGDGTTGIVINPLASIKRALGQQPEHYQPPMNPLQKLRYDQDAAKLLALVKRLPVSAPDGRAIGFAVPANVLKNTVDDYPPLPSGVKDGINIPLPETDISRNKESMRLLAREIGSVVGSMPTRPVVVLSAPEPTASAMQREIDLFSRNTSTVRLNTAVDAKKAFLTIYLPTN